jgi:hypothetical protein
LPAACGLHYLYVWAFKSGAEAAERYKTVLDEHETLQALLGKFARESMARLGGERGNRKRNLIEDVGGPQYRDLIQ